MPSLSFDRDAHAQTAHAYRVGRTLGLLDFLDEHGYSFYSTLNYPARSEKDFQESKAAWQVKQEHGSELFSPGRDAVNSKSSNSLPATPFQPLRSPAKAIIIDLANEKPEKIVENGNCAVTLLYIYSSEKIDKPRFTKKFENVFPEEVPLRDKCVLEVS